jgi:hypothetical protein
VSQQGAPVRRDGEMVWHFGKGAALKCNLDYGAADPGRVHRQRPEGPNTSSNPPGIHKGWDGYSPCTEEARTWILSTSSTTTGR